MLEIIPAILEKDWQNIERKINLVKSFAKTIQIDLIDGKFLPQQTFLDPKPFAKSCWDYFMELHLMVENPLDYIKPFADVGFKRFIAHVEALPGLEDQENFIKQGKLFGEVGLAIDKSTDISSVKVPLSSLDCLLIMLVKAGSSGQTFDVNVLEKIKQLKARTQIPIEVDGGINLESATKAKESGATRFSVNSFLFKANPPVGGPKGNYNLLKKSLGLT
jgi:ribulose-phosphate 3-epimerase